MDRNREYPLQDGGRVMSLSARRAWIEICTFFLGNCPQNVALRKESVDRNVDGYGCAARLRGSLSARRAWIEIITYELTGGATMVALRKESVDRNVRGVLRLLHRGTSLSARRAWIEIVFRLVCPALQPSLSARRAWIEIRASSTFAIADSSRSPQGERG